MSRFVQRIVPMLMLAVFLLVNRTDAAQTVDMYGRTVDLPGRIDKVVAASPPVTYMVCTIDPCLIGALNVPSNRNLQKYLGKDIKNLPVIGGFGGGSKNFNAEVLVESRPDLVIVWPPPSGFLNPMARRVLDLSGIPYVLVKLDTLEDYPQAYEYLGKLLGREARGKKLATYFRKALKKLRADAAGISERQRVSVYFAEGLDGLTTVSSDSVHGEVLALAGGRNVYPIKSGSRQHKHRLSIEQVLLFDPEVIVVQEPSFFNEIHRDSRWREIRAVRNKRVVLEPNIPFNWMDRPPSFLRLLGAKWLAGILYPHRENEKVLFETREFFKLFLGKMLDDEDLRSLLNNTDRP